MKRVVSLSRNHSYPSHLLRSRVLSALRAALCLTVIPTALVSTADAQMRTGRGTREIYQEEEEPTPARKQQSNEDREKKSSASSKVPAKKGSASKEASRDSQSSNSKTNESDTQVRRASAEEPVSPRSTSRNSSVQRASSTQHSNNGSQASGPSRKSSKVVPASCENCGNGHSVRSSGPMERVVEDYQFSDSGCSSCDGTGCDECDCCDSCDPCDLAAGVDRRFYIDLGCGPLANTIDWFSRNTYSSAQAASFMQRGANLPALATGGTNSALQGPVLFGADRVNDASRIGYRSTFGVWLDPYRDKALQFRMYDAGTWSTDFNRDQTNIVGANVLTRPYTDENGNARTVVIVDDPAVPIGSMTARVTTKSYGGDLLLRKRILQNRNARWDFLIGYQQARVNEDLLINSTSNNGTVILGIRDHFSALNRFEAMAWGFQRFSRFGNFSLESTFKLGMGNMRRHVEIDGSRSTTTIVGAPGTVTENQGLLARRTNAGDYINDTFMVSPEIGINLGYRVTRQMDLTVGYTYLGLPKAARVGDQVDTRSNLNGAGLAVPIFTLRESPYTLQSFNFGGQWRF